MNKIFAVTILMALVSSCAQLPYEKRSIASDANDSTVIQANEKDFEISVKTYKRNVAYEEMNSKCPNGDVVNMWKKVGVFKSDIYYGTCTERNNHHPWKVLNIYSTEVLGKSGPQNYQKFKASREAAKKDCNDKNGEVFDTFDWCDIDSYSKENGNECYSVIQCIVSRP